VVAGAVVAGAGLAGLAGVSGIAGAAELGDGAVIGAGTPSLPSRTDLGARCCVDIN